MYLLMGIFMLVGGAVAVFFPDMIFELKESWKSYSAADPSDLYLLFTRIGGVIFMLSGVAGIVLQFTL